MTDDETIPSALEADPHAVLGPHEQADGVVVRAYWPGALAVRVIPDDRAAEPMHALDGSGLFEAHLRGQHLPLRYTVEIRDARGVVCVADPYAFVPEEAPPSGTGPARYRAILRRMGAHVVERDGVTGTAFAVWAPEARCVSVTGDFDAWDQRRHPMRRMTDGVWELFVPGVAAGAIYKYAVTSKAGETRMKSDPFGARMELRPNTGSRVTDSRYTFTDQAWLRGRSTGEPRRKPLSIYEVHLGSWRLRGGHLAPASRDPAVRFPTYRELATTLVDYVADLGFSHVELLPVMEHPYDGSWGYQVSGYFAPTARYGEPDDLRYFVDRCHEAGIGVLLDWTPAHFPKDAAALGRFDGTALYEHLDPRQGEHKHWDTFIFNYGRPEVKDFLVASALHWFDAFHVDGLRVDAVASMLYLDYSARGPGDWVPNEFGGRENLEAVALIRELNETLHTAHPGALTIAEESTTWPGVTRPTYVGGLGFDFKWNMGWMHDTLDYFSLDPIHRAFHHQLLTFGIMYAFSERFLLPLSHDEVVHLKKSLLSKMAGDRWKQHASLRALYAYMWAHPGKKLLFMGGEFGQETEWNHEDELAWFLLDEPDHGGLQKVVRELNRAYKAYPALHEVDDDIEGFSWIDANDAIQSIASFIRYPKQPPSPPVIDTVKKRAERPKSKGKHVVFAGNFTPVPRFGYRLGVPRSSRYLEVLNTDAVEYGGSGMGNLGAVEIQPVPSHGFAQSIVVTLPPLAALYFVPELDEDPPAVAALPDAAPAAAAE